MHGLRHFYNRLSLRHGLCFWLKDTSALRVFGRYSCSSNGWCGNPITWRIRLQSSERTKYAHFPLKLLKVLTTHPVVSQLVFASLTPHNHRHALITNVVSAAISTAGASQTGDLAYDFKIGELVGAAPSAQMYAQIIGSIFGCFVSVATYRLYTSMFPIPGSFLQIPTRFIQIRTGELLLGRGLPEGVPPFALGTSLFFAAATIMRTAFKGRWWVALIPSDISFALGIFIASAFTMPRVAGGICVWFLASVLSVPRSTVGVIGSGLIVGESVGTLSYLLLKAINAPQWGED